MGNFCTQFPKDQNNNEESQSSNNNNTSSSSSSTCFNCFESNNNFEETFDCPDCNDFNGDGWDCNCDCGCDIGSVDCW